MNGQEKSQAHIPTDLPTGSGTANGSSAPNGGAPGSTPSAVNSNSWLKDVMANPLRAAQAGLINRPDDPAAAAAMLPAHIDAALARGSFVYPYQAFMFGSNPLPTLAPMGESANISPASTSTPAQVNQQHQHRQQQLLMQANYYGDVQAASQEKPPADSNSAKGVSLKHPSTHVGNNSEPVTKRSRVDASSLPTPSYQTESVPVPGPPGPPLSASLSASLPTPNLNSRGAIPHRPEYFRKGSIIQLGDSKLKRIEDLCTADFESSSHLNPDLCLDCSIVTKIMEEPQRGTVFLSFSIGEQRQDQVHTIKNIKS